ncbi:MAG: hypothetical protein ACLUSP_06805 [Christensenellales bacterium]
MRDVRRYLYRLRQTKVDTDTHIEIYSYQAGFGTEWITAAADKFIAKKPPRA